KISYILSFVLLSAGFVACDNEPIDEEVKNDYKQGEQILRFDLNGVTRVAKGNEISTSVSGNGSLTIDVNIKDQHNDFRNISFRIVGSGAENGNHGYYYRHFSPGDEGYSSARVNYAGDVWDWDYSTQYANQDIPDEQIFELIRGSVTSTEINENARQIEGNFE